MDKKIIILIIIAAVIAILLIAALCSHFSKGKRKGRAAEKKVASLLKKLSKNDRSRVMNNVYLPLYNKACEIDHLVFGRFGILVLETKGISGEVVGSGKNLTHNIGHKTHKFYNPQMQNKTHMDNVIHHLKKGGFDRVPVKGAVVFTDKELKYPEGLGMSIDGLKKFYESLPDAGCNQDVLYDYFDKLKVRSTFRKLSIRFGKKND